MKKTRLGIVGTYIYLMLPFILFILGWLKTWFAIPMIVILLFSFYKMLQHAPELWIPELNRDNIEKIIFIVSIICFWVYLSGIGKMVFQNTDHVVRNAMFDLLVLGDWPIMGEDVAGNSTSLIYYTGFWIPAAAVGKVLGLQAGYYMLMIWAVLGLVLVYYFICARSQRLEVWPIVVLIFFSGLDIVGHYLIGTEVGTMSRTLHLEWWNNPYQLSSTTTQLFWVFNQCIPAWLATALVMELKDNRSIVIIWATTMLTSTLPFVGLLPIIVYMIFHRGCKKLGKENFIHFFKELFTFENVVGGGIVGIVSFLYLSGNLSGGMVSTSAKASSSNGYNGSLLLWIICIILEVGIYLLLIYKKQRNNKLYYIIVMELCLFPLIRVGTSNDFCMRAVIPAQFILMLYIIDLLREAAIEKKRILLVSTIIILGIGSVTPINEFTRTISETVTRQRQNISVEAETMGGEGLLEPGNFSGEIENNFFYRFFVK